MGRSNRMGQLAKGVVIGIILLLAIIGTMTIIDSAKDKKTYIPVNNQTTSTSSKPSTPSSSADLDKKTPTEQVNNNPASNSSTPIDSANSSVDSSATTDIADANKNTDKAKDNTNFFKPVLENERTLKEVEKKKVQFGLLQVSAINPNNKQKLFANFVILDKKGKKVAEANNKKQTSFRLPIGKYKVISTLKKPDNAVRNSQVVQSTKTVRINTNKKTIQLFKLEPPTTLGVLQVSAKNAQNGRVIKANYIIQKENGNTIATRNNVTHTLFKLKAGSYKVMVKSGNNSDFRTVVVEPGESTKQVFQLQETIKLGKVHVRILDTRSSKSVNADIIITTGNGIKMQELKAVSQTEVSLPAGQYRIRVTGPTGQSSKTINIAAGQSINETFRFDVPSNTPNSTPINTPEPTQKTTATTRVIDTPATALPPVQEVKKQQQAKASILLYAKNKGNNTPLKSNFYIQMPNGKNIAKKIYSESAQFSLAPGIYKVTVRSKNRKNLTKTIRIASGEKISEVFSLQSSLPKPIKEVATQQANAQPTPPVLAPHKPSKPVKSINKVEIIPTGFLKVAMQPPKKTHFIIATRSGKKIVELTSVPNASFKLDTGEYVVTAIHNKKRRTKAIKVHKNKTSQIHFNAANFTLPKKEPRKPPAFITGTLKSRIIDQNGQALRGNLTVVNVYGEVVARANAVTVGVFNLPPEPYTIILNYRGLRGSEQINIRPHETTMHTFTVEP